MSVMAGGSGGGGGGAVDGRVLTLGPPNVAAPIHLRSAVNNNNNNYSNKTVATTNDAMHLDGSPSVVGFAMTATELQKHTRLWCTHI